jgi:HSP20 family molecular chaperone IbpA
MTTQELTRKDKQELEQRDLTRAGRAFVPDVDISEDDEALWFWADMPGVAPGQADVQLVDDTLRIEGQVSLEEYEGLTPVYTEYNVGHYFRRFTLSNGERFDRDRIAARLANGVLEIKLPKGERARPRKIPIGG